MDLDDSGIGHDLLDVENVRFPGDVLGSGVGPGQLVVAGHAVY